MKKIFISILLVMILITIPCTTIFASQDLGLGTLENYRGTNPESETLKTKANNILGAIQIVGIVASVITLMITGIKYMLGSVEEKAEYKNTLKPYVIGAFILFTGSFIPNLIYQFAQNM